MADLKKVYTAVDEQTALSALEDFDEEWGNKYPKIAISWRNNWANLSTYFKYPQEIRTLIYTTNSIEGFNRQLRKVTKNKGVFPTDDSLLKMLYLAMMDITKKWISPLVKFLDYIIILEFTQNRGNTQENRLNPLK